MSDANDTKPSASVSAATVDDGIDPPTRAAVEAVMRNPLGLERWWVEEAARVTCRTLLAQNLEGQTRILARELRRVAGESVELEEVRLRMDRGWREKIE